MSEESKQVRPPYVPWGTFLNFINALAERPLPGVVDRSLVQHLSGSVQSILLVAMRSTGMTDDHGVPTQRLFDYVKGTEDARKQVLQAALKDGFPFFFDGSVDLMSITPAQFDERLREAGGLSGSTRDKAASFFLGGAEHVGIEIGAYLKKRKPSSRRTPKQKKAKESTPLVNTPPASDPQADSKKITEKALEYRLVDLMGEASDDVEVMEAIWTVVRYLKTKPKAKETPSAGGADASDSTPDEAATSSQDNGTA